MVKCAVAGGSSLHKRKMSFHSYLACLHRTGVPHDSPLEGQSPWDFALITPGVAYFVLFHVIFPFLAANRAA